MLPPALFLLSLAAMALLHLTLPLAVFVPSVLRPAGLFLLVGGLLAARWGKRRFARAGTEINTFGTPSRLVIDGLFRISRNPMYLGFVVALLGLWLLLGTASPGVAVLVFAGAADRFYVPFEERRMAEQFGAAYAAYMSRTRRWI